MERLAMVRIASRTAAHYAGTLADAGVTAISTDSRNIPAGCLFVAIKGETFDGHHYVTDGLRSGASYAMVMDRGRYPEEQILLVKDTKVALLEIANLYRRLLGLQVVGVTGSVGKTTTKEMIASVLAAAMPTLKTEANLNNEIGLPQTIFRLTGEHKAAVLEMGMDGPGQIAPLSRCAQPDIGVITNIGVSHMEALGSRTGILWEKLDITAGMKDGAPLVLCGDDDMLTNLRDIRQTPFYYGIDNQECPVAAEGIREFSTHTTFTIRSDGNRYDAVIPCMGKHNVYNALAAFSVGKLMGVEPQTAVSALKNVRPTGMRQNIVVHNSYTVVEDCYNASPDSMQAALSTLGRMECDGKRIAVLGDMLELGEIASRSHKEVGAMAQRNDVDFLLCTGPLAKLYVEGAVEAGMNADYARHFESREALFDVLRELLAPGDVAWFKASRAMELEKVIARIYAEC